MLLNLNNHYRGCASRSPEASETQLRRVKAICDLARLASGIIVVISVFNSLLNNVFCLCTAWHAHTVFSYVYCTTRIRCLTHKLQQCLQTRTNTQQTKELKNYNVRYHPLIIIIISLFRTCYTCLSTVHYKHTCIQSYNKQNIC